MNTESFYQQLQRRIIREFNTAIEVESLNKQPRPAAEIIEEALQTRIRELNARIATIPDDSPENLELIGFTEFIIQVYLTTAARETDRWRRIARDRTEKTHRKRIKYRRVTRQRATTPAADNDLF